MNNDSHKLTYDCSLLIFAKAPSNTFYKHMCLHVCTLFMRYIVKSKRRIVPKINMFYVIMF